MPIVAIRISTGYSNRSSFSAFMVANDMMSASAEANSTMTFMTRAKVSTLRRPLKAVAGSGPPRMTSPAAAASAITARTAMRSKLSRRSRMTPSISSTSADTTSAISGRAAWASASARILDIERFPSGRQRGQRLDHGEPGGELVHQAPDGCGIKIHDRCRIDPEQYGERRQRHQRRGLAPVDIEHAAQRRLGQRPEDHPAIEIERIGRRQDDAERR